MIAEHAIDPFLFMPEPSLENMLHLDRYRHFIWSRLFRVLPQDSRVEKHHIVPAAFGMDKSKKSQPWNIISLSPREHYIAHLLLWKTFRDPKMSYAFFFLSQRYRCTSGRVYEELQQDRREAISKVHKGKIVSFETRQKMSKSQKTNTARYHLPALFGPDNPNYGKTHTDAAKEKCRQANLKQDHRNCIWITDGTKSKFIHKTSAQQYIVAGWVYGRSKFKKILEREKR